MSRKREAPPKPEELIAKLEEKFNEFKTLIESKNEEQDKVNEEIKVLISEVQGKQDEQKQEFESRLEAISEQHNILIENLRLEKNLQCTQNPKPPNLTTTRLFNLEKPKLLSLSPQHVYIYFEELVEINQNMIYCRAKGSEFRPKMENYISFSFLY